MPSKEAGTRYFPYPAVAFNFIVSVDGVTGTAADGTTADASFQEVSGIKVDFNHEEVQEGGENRFVHRLPKTPRYGNLVLKRGVVAETSRLAQWVGETLGSTFARQIKPRTVTVTLRNENCDPLIHWTFVNAYPVSWDIAQMNAMENTILTETMELSYNYFTREMPV
jgi:phage tail-like protein